MDRLRRRHEGRDRSDDELSVRQSEWDKKRVAEAICSGLPLAQHERDKVVNVVGTIDFSKFGQQKGLERVTLGVVAVVVDEQHRQRLGEDAEFVSFSDEVKRVRDRLDISMSDLSTIKAIVRKALEEGGATQNRREPRRDILLPDPTPVSEYPREYWDGHEAEYWVHNAKAWSRLPVEFKEGIPDDYRVLIENLRKWRPWEDEAEASDTRDDTPAAEHKANAENVEEELDALERELADLDEEVEQEAEQFLEEMDESES